MTESRNGSGARRAQPFHPIAVIGVGCLFPKAADARAYWANIKGEVDAITDIPPTHWRTEDYYSPDPKATDRTYGKRGGFLSPVDFSPLDFGLPPKDIEATDTSQLLGMVAARQALVDAGYGPERAFNRERVSTILGVTGALELTVTLGARLGHPRWRKALKDAGVDDATAQDVLERIAESYVPWQENSFPGLLGNVVAGRIARHLNLGGTNCVVDAACASSFSAIHMASMELAAGRSDMVITGGVDTFNDIFMYICFSKTPALSPTGDSRPFDASCDGMILGEGLGMLVLKRLEDAERDGDRVYGVLRGVGTSSDGAGEAIYAPNFEGQAKAMRRAYEMAGFGPETVELMEAHGTGTKVGDATELRTMREVFGNAQGQPWCALGSVKSQIGHTKAAAGVAGLIKVLFALHHKVLPPTIKVQKPAEILTEPGSPFYVNTVKRPWVAPDGHPRRAAVSSFGFGGSNYHCVLEEHRPVKTVPDWDGDVELVALSAADPAALKQRLGAVKAAESWQALAKLASESRRTFDPGAKCRLVLVLQQDKTSPAKLIDSAMAMLDKQGAAASWSLPDGAFYASGERPGSLAVLFSGQGSQYVGMGRDLACQFPEMLAAFELADSVTAKDAPPSAAKLSAVVYPAPAFDATAQKAREEALRATDRAQPALGAVSVGLWKILKSFGFSPDMSAGHSYGELVALHAAGIISEDALYHLSRVRGTLMAQGSGDRGGMLAVKCALDRLEAVLREEKIDLALANKNTPDQFVLSGDSAEIRRAKEAFGKRNIHSTILPVAAAFHSRYVADAEKAFHKELLSTEIAPGRIPAYSNTTADPHPKDAASLRSLLASQLARPVEFVSEIENMYRAGARTFVEIGPGDRLTGLVQSILQGRPFQALAVDASAGRRGGVADLARALAQLAALGYPLDLTSWNANWFRSAEIKKSKMSIPVSGANYVSPRATRPPAPTPVQPPAPPVAAQAAPATAPQPGADWMAAYRSSQENLVALQRLYEQTAQLHHQFLEGQTAAAGTLQSLITQHQQLVQGGVPQIPATPQPAAIAPPAPALPPPALAQPPALIQAPAPSAAPAIPATPPAATASAPAVPAPSAGKAQQVLLRTIAEKTGYPEDILELDMTLDADLGIDSIKRVEILSAIKDQLPEAPIIGPEHLGQLQTLRAIVDFLEAGTPPTQVPAPQPVSGADSSRVQKVLLRTIAEKTGYPEDILELDMTLDADLGIDSIKRVEILSALKDQLPEAPVIGPEQLGQLHTLRAIIDFLSAGAPATAVPEPQLTGGVDSSRVQQILLKTIAEKTGYPEDILELDMTLDADLGIDSIKRVEILSALRDQLPEAPLIGPEQLGQLQTLRAIVNYLGAATPASPAAPAAAPAAPAASATPEYVRRSILASVPWTAKGESLKLPADAPLWITEDDAGFAKKIAVVLSARGYRAQVISRTAPPPVPEKLGMLALLSPAHPAASLLQESFVLLKSLSVPLRKTPGSVFATISRMDGRFGLGDASSIQPVSGGLAGLSKTAAREWPEVHCRAFDVESAWTADGAAEAWVDALLGGAPMETGLTRQGLFTIQLIEGAAPAGLRTAFQPEDVIVISGGARGITAEAAVALAERFRPTLILLGRSAEPQEEPAWLAHIQQEADVRQALIRNQSGLKPAEIEREFRRVMANREARHNINRMTGRGAKVRYFSVDIRNGESVRACIAKVRSEHGPIRGLIHGAGVILDRLIEDKTPEQFDLVYGTKVEGLQHLLSATEQDPLSALVLFSSSTGRFGRRGQVDYAVANEVLNKMAQRERARRPDCRVLSVNWGPWDGGMVTPALKQVFASEGVEVIGLRAGVSYLLEEMAQEPGAPCEVVALGSREPQQVLKPQPAPQPHEAPVEPEPRSSSGAMETAFTVSLDVESFPFLRSHVLNGKAVLPTVMMMEWMSHAALHVNPGLRFHGVNDLHILKGVILENSEPVPIRLRAGKCIEHDGMYVAQAEIRSGWKRETLHASAQILLGNQHPRLNGMTREMPEATIDQPVAAYSNGELFHGHDFQGLLRVSDCSELTFAAETKVSPPPSLWSAAPLRKNWIADPLALDSAFQTLILWCFRHYQSGSLPTRIQGYRQYAKSFPQDRVRIFVRIARHDVHRVLSEIDFFDPKTGQLVARIESYECTMVSSLRDAFQRNTLQQGTAH